MRQSWKFRVTVMLATVFLASASFAEETAEKSIKKGFQNQVFFRGAYSRMMENSRGGEVFTDTQRNTFFNGNRDGFSIAAGLDLGMAEMNGFLDARVIGEVFAEYTRFAASQVTQTTSALLAAPRFTKVSVAELNVTIAPKVMFNASGHIRPFVIPLGLAFLVNSPPSNDSTYLDVGLHFAGGVDFKIVDGLSVGTDIRYTHGFEHSNTSTRYLSPGGYIAWNF